MPAPPPIVPGVGGLVGAMTSLGEQLGHFDVQDGGQGTRSSGRRDVLAAFEPAHRLPMYASAASEFFPRQTGGHTEHGDRGRRVGP